MNDLDFVRDLRADVPEATAEQLAAGRERLLAAIASSHPHRARSRLLWPRLALAMAAAALVAVVVAISLPRHVGGEAPVVPGGRMTLADQVLHRAAAARSAHPAAEEPAPDQWIYQYTVDQSIGESTQAGGNWERFDGRQTASMVGGRLVIYDEQVAGSPSGTPLERYLADATPQTTYELLASLPADPHALLAQVDSAVRGGGYDSHGLPLFDVVPTATTAQREFQFIAELLWQDTQSGVVSGASSLFDALATLPGVAAEPGITDALGRAAIGISDDEGAFQILLSPQTYQVLGIRSVSTGDAPHLPNGGTAPRGTVVQSFATEDTLVAAPGDR
jgi:hypothetical protein